MRQVTVNGPAIFVPIRAVRCGPPGSSGSGRTKIAHIGYYGGRKVIRWRCNSEECRWDTSDGNRKRIVTFHHDDLETGERVLPDERRPYEPQERGNGRSAT